MINTSTDLYCVLGWPVGHSKSPLIHNRAFADQKINAVYLAFEPRDIGSAVESVRTLQIKGASVTIPFKESVMTHLDWIDEEALGIGAVNTLVNKNGKLLGYNTDSKAAVDPLKPFGIKDKTVCIIGAGGAAKAVAYGIWKHQGRLVITNRTVQKGRDLADRFQGRFVLPQDLKSLDPDIVINTTSLGMEPDIDQMAYPARLLKPGMVVMDAVYTPLNTGLISAAREKGCDVIDGLSMFIAQGAAQFRLWTGIEPDLEILRKTVLENR
ncbi:shikimate dehydrogenase [Desulfospira joergensenii]|uniref:shikimate dehydrogenase n=1 Tax=Desulfospira joergensenii TaxID=53329 RepID=UPI0003B633C4|nr:shikimate dehydrogenase [Desulfospira joergensenii]